MPKLNFPQKVFLAIFGLIVLFIQILKFDDYGIEGIGWVFSLVISALLILPILTEVEKIKLLLKPRYSNKENKSKFENVVGKNIVSENLLELQSDAIDLQKGIANLITIPELNFNLLSNTWFQYCLPYTLALNSASKYKKSMSYFSSGDYQTLVNQSVKLICENSYTSLKELGVSSIDTDLIKKEAIRNIIHIENEVIRQLGNKNKNSELEMIGFLLEKLGIGGDLKQKVEPFVKEFTNNLIQKYN
jgi:hypothetical protein